MEVKDHVRAEFLGIPLVNLHESAANMRGKLQKLFQVYDSKETPRIVTGDIKDEAASRQSSHIPLLIYPQASEEEELAIGVRVLDYSRYQAVYDSNFNMIFLNKSFFVGYGMGSIGYALSEEVTHSLISVRNPRAPISTDDIRQFKGISSDYGERKADFLAENLQNEQFYVDLNEFFPPIAQRYLNIDNIAKANDWMTLNSRIHEHESIEDKKRRVKRLTYYLPQRAGELLLQNYSLDSQIVMQNHPELPFLTGQELWTKYCLPLLKTNRLGS